MFGRGGVDKGVYSPQPPREPLERAVRILLECFLVFKLIFFYVIVGWPFL